MRAFFRRQPDPQPGAKTPKKNLLWVYLNGKYIRENNALSINDRGFLLGDGLFETIYCYSGMPLFLEEHWIRLSKGLDFLNIPLQLKLNELKKIIVYLLQENLLQKEASIRITVTRGVSPRGISTPAVIKPTVLITSSALISSPKTIKLGMSILLAMKSPLFLL